MHTDLLSQSREMYHLCDEIDGERPKLAVSRTSLPALVSGGHSDNLHHRLRVTTGATVDKQGCCRASSLQLWMDVFPMSPADVSLESLNVVTV